MAELDYKWLYEDLLSKVGRMRALQHKKKQLKNYFPVQDRQALYRAEIAVDDHLRMDQEGALIYQNHQKNKQQYGSR